MWPGPRPDPQPLCGADLPSLMVLVPLLPLLGRRVPLSHGVLLSRSCAVSSGTGTHVLGNLDTGSGEGPCASGASAALPLLLQRSLSSQDLTPGSVEEAEEAEPDEEFKDAIEVGGPSPAPSTDQTRRWVVLELRGFSRPKSGCET